MTDQPSLKALPGRVLMEFDPPQSETKGGILVPNTSQRRSEIGRIIDIGDALTDEHAKIVRNLRKGDRVPVVFGAGAAWYFGDYGDDFSPVRAFTIGELAARLVRPEEARAAQSGPLDAAIDEVYSDVVDAIMRDRVPIEGL